MNTETTEKSGIIMPHVREERQSPAHLPAIATPAQMLQAAILNKTDPGILKELMALQKEWEANQARKAYVEAMAAFKKNPPKIIKDKLVSFPTSKGKTEYKHATLGAVCGAVVDGLAGYGFSHSWSVNQPEGGLIEVSCIITHSLGHSERVTLKAGKDDSGGKNSIQSIASTVSYLERYTLLSACGLATHDQDDDARQAEPEEPAYLAGAELEEFKTRANRSIVNMPKFLEFLGIESLDKLPLILFSKAMTTVNAREKEMAKKA